jgi:RNase adaptor protein for sRNA GlmZ degradation
MGDSSDEDQFYVNIVSYGHSNGPLIVPREHHRLNFNVRDIPNPAAGLRRTHTGLSARLKKEVLATKEAQERLAEMVKKVNAKMEEVETKYVNQNYDDVEKPDQPEVKKYEKVYAGEFEHREDVESESSSTLVVAVYCEEGRHRSVAFAEELGRSLKRRDWDVTIDHRDLTGYSNDEPETPVDSPTSPTLTNKPKTKKQKNQESRRRKTSQRGFLEDEE